jgi:hypothetical protein
MDHRFGSPRPFRQIYDAVYSPIQTNTPVNADPGHFMQMPVTAAWRGKGLFAWADARLNGLNIYASQEIYEPTDVDEDNTPLPVSFDLAQNYPNPFNPSTMIRFSLDRPGAARLDIFNLLGRKVRTLVDAEYPAGEHTVTWDGADDNGRKVSSGMYLYRLTAAGQSLSRKMTLVK